MFGDPAAPAGRGAAIVPRRGPFVHGNEQPAATTRGWPVDPLVPADAGTQRLAEPWMPAAAGM